MRKADKLLPSCAVVTKSGSLNFLEPTGPVQACNGTALPFYMNCKYVLYGDRGEAFRTHSRVYAHCLQYTYAGVMCLQSYRAIRKRRNWGGGCYCQLLRQFVVHLSNTPPCATFASHARLCMKVCGVKKLVFPVHTMTA